MLKYLKDTSALVVLGFIISIATTVFIFWDDHNLKQIDYDYIKSIQPYVDEENFYFHIDEFLYEVDNIKIRGYGFFTNEDIKKFKNHIILKEKNSEKYLLVPTVMEIRQDVEDTLGNGNKIKYSGFISNIDARKLEFEKIYEVFYLYESNNNKMLIKTDLEIKR